jgi:hypothetical protein
MKLGDLVKFIERHEDGEICQVFGIVIDEMSCDKDNPLYKIRWFNEKDVDTWHISPEEMVEEGAAKDLFIISEA